MSLKVNEVLKDGNLNKLFGKIKCNKSYIYGENIMASYLHEMINNEINEKRKKSHKNNKLLKNIIQTFKNR